jgi:hypothetical protein
VKEAGSLKQEDVIQALDHAKITVGPGGPAEVVPGQHHVRMNMYIAQASNSRSVRSRLRDAPRSLKPGGQAAWRSLRHRPG